MNQLRRVKLSCSFLVWTQLAVEGTIKVYSDQFVQVEPWSQSFDTITSNSDFLVYHLSALDMGAFFATIIASVFFVFSIRLLFRSHVEIFWRLAVFGFTKISYDSPVYAASVAEHSTVQQILLKPFYILC